MTTMKRTKREKRELEKLAREIAELNATANLKEWEYLNAMVEYIHENRKH